LRVFYKTTIVPCGVLRAYTKTPQHHQLSFSLTTITNAIDRFNEPRQLLSQVIRKILKQLCLFDDRYPSLTHL
jgi:hypothetical protein